MQEEAMEVGFIDDFKRYLCSNSSQSLKKGAVLTKDLVLLVGVKITDVTLPWL